MLKNCFDRFKSDHFGFVLYENTLRIHFWCILEAKSMVLWRFLMIFDKHVKNRCRLYGSTRNFMIRSTVMVKNCIDIIFEGLRDIFFGFLVGLFFHYILLYCHAYFFSAWWYIDTGHAKDWQSLEEAKKI